MSVEVVHSRRDELIGVDHAVIVGVVEIEGGVGILGLRSNRQRNSHDDHTQRGSQQQRDPGIHPLKVHSQQALLMRVIYP